MPEIQNPEIVRNIEKRYNIRGYPGPGILAPEIVPVSIVDDITGEADRETHPYWGYLQQAAGGAGTYAAIALVNPSESGVIVQVTAVNWQAGTSGGAVNMRRNVTATPTGAVGTADKNLDGRSAASATAYLKKEASGAQITPEFYVVQNGTATTHLELLPYNIILEPTNTFWVQAVTANINIHVNFIWTERPLTVADSDVP